MKKEFFSLLLMMVSISMYAQQEQGVNQHDALELVKASYEGQDVDYYIGHVYAGDTICYDQRLVVSTSENWIIFVDEEPMQPWGHNCSSYTIPCDVRGDDAVIAEHQVLRLPPYGVQLSPLEVRQRAQLRMMRQEQQYTINTTLNTNLYPDKHHVIIMNCSTPTLNQFYQTGIYECQTFLQVIKNQYEIRDENIDILISDGQYSDSIMSATSDISKESVQNVLAKYRSLPQDHVVHVFITGAGDFTLGNDNTFSGGLYLWSYNAGGYASNYMHDSEFLELVDSIQHAIVNVVMGTRGSGNFASLLTRQNTVIATACDESENQDAQFLTNWTQSLTGRVGDSTIDYDGDPCVVTLSEAFQYAEENCESYPNNTHTPQYKSLPSTLGANLAFNMINPPMDLYLRDNADDTGKEPNKSLGGLFPFTPYNSPDIILRNSLVPISLHPTDEPIVYEEGSSTTKYAYVNVRNRGWESYNGDSLYLNLYFKIGNMYYRPGHIYNEGDSDSNRFYLNSYQIPSVSAGQHIQMACSFDLPNNVVRDLIENSTLSCAVLATITSGVGSTTFPLTPLQYNRVVTYNDMTAKNTVCVIMDGSSSVQIMLPVTNMSDEGQNYSLEFYDENDLFSDIRVETRLPNDSVCVLTSADDAINGIVVAAGQQEDMGVSLTLKNPSVSKDKYLLHVAQRNLSTGMIENTTTIKILRDEEIGDGDDEQGNGMIAALACSDDQLNVEFSSPVSSDALLRISYPGSSMSVIEIPIATGCTSKNVAVPTSYSGLVVVSLVEDGVVVDTKKTVKQ